MEKKYTLVLFVVFSVGLFYKSFEIHEVLFSHYKAKKAERCYSGFVAVSGNPAHLSFYHKLFNVEPNRPKHRNSPELCKDTEQFGEEDDKEK
ncbi:MAG: hypothetical protein ACQEQL_06625 [Pseudomonadota bacterium]